MNKVISFLFLFCLCVSCFGQRIKTDHIEIIHVQHDFNIDSTDRESVRVVSDSIIYDFGVMDWDNLIDVILSKQKNKISLVDTYVISKDNIVFKPDVFCIKDNILIDILVSDTNSNVSINDKIRRNDLIHIPRFITSLKSRKR